MTPELTMQLANLRCCVAFLGEKEQHGWWSSSFLSKSGGAFLNPVFPKTSFLARLNGASAAAQLVHDQYIGVGEVIHLFRLPENVESDMSQLLVSELKIFDNIRSEDYALGSLQSMAVGEKSQGVGPFLLNQNEFAQDTVNQMAALYLSGFNASQSVYPYFRGNL